MPIFMDRHDIPGVNAKDVAEAHQKDLAIQDQYSCRALTYWFDEEKGMAFCLIEAPDKASVQDLHNYAHGLIPNEIIEVEPGVVESFLGRIEDPEDSDDSRLAIISDPAFRSIMVVFLTEGALLHLKTEIPESDPLKSFHHIFQEEVNNHSGSEVEHANGCFMASFASVSQSVRCAEAIQRSGYLYDSGLAEENKLFRIGISAGVPVSGDDSLFGGTVRLATRLGLIAPPGQIVLSALVSDLYKARVSGNGMEKTSAVSTLRAPEENFLNRVMDIAEERACNTGFDVNDFAAQTGMSRSKLYRKLTSLTGYSPNDFIREFRLRKAFHLIDKQEGNISEVAYQTGFNSLSYFSKRFQDRFGVLPSDFVNSLTFK